MPTTAQMTGPSRSRATTAVGDVQELGAASKRRRPESLVELFTIPKAAAPELLARLLKRNAWITSPDDQEKALGLLDDRDPDLAKTRTLAQHVATNYDGRFAASFEAFLVRATAPVLEETPGRPPIDGGDGPALFAAVLDHHAAELSKTEPPRRLFNAVMIAQSILMARYRLDIPDAVPLLANSRPTSRASGRAPKPSARPLAFSRRYAPYGGCHPNMA